MNGYTIEKKGMYRRRRGEAHSQDSIKSIIFFIFFVVTSVPVGNKIHKLVLRMETDSVLFVGINK